MCHYLFGGDNNFLEFDIEDFCAPQILSERVGVELNWWGVANRSSGLIAV